MSSACFSTLLLQGRRPDVAFTRWHLAVFVDGGFWHSCPGHGSRRRTNTDYWNPKMDGNTLFCADDGVNVTGTTWSSWTQTNAYGNGMENKHICEPNCAEGREERSSVQVTLVEPMDGGFTRAILTHLDGRAESYSLVNLGG